MIRPPREIFPSKTEANRFGFDATARHNLHNAVQEKRSIYDCRLIILSNIFVLHMLSCIGGKYFYLAYIGYVSIILCEE